MSNFVRFRVPDEWMPAIFEACQQAGIDPEVKKGVSSGYPLWIKQLVARELGLEVEDYHETRSQYWASQTKG